MPAKFTVYKDKASKFRFNLKAGNGEIIATSESYPDKKSALKGVASVVKSAAVAAIEDTTVEDAALKATKPKAAKAPKATKPKAAKAVKATKPKAAKAPKATKPKV